MRPTQSKVEIIKAADRREVFVTTAFTDKTPHEVFDRIQIEVRESAVMLRRKQFDQFFLTKDQVSVLSEAIEQAKG